MQFLNNIPVMGSLDGVGSFSHLLQPLSLVFAKTTKEMTLSEGLRVLPAAHGGSGHKTVCWGNGELRPSLTARERGLSYRGARSPHGGNDPLSRSPQLWPQNGLRVIPPWVYNTALSLLGICMPNGGSHLSGSPEARPCFPPIQGGFLFQWKVKSMGGLWALADCPKTWASTAE